MNTTIHEETDMPQMKQKPAQPVAADRKPKPAVELKLTDFQTFVCDLAGSVILRGGHDDDADNVAFYLCRHYYRTMFPRFGSDETPETANARAEKFAEDNYRDWLAKLRRQWPAPDEQPLDDGLVVSVVHPEPKGVVQRVHAVLRADLERRMREFMNEALTEDKYLLRDILCDWEGNGGYYPLSIDSEVLLATAFMYQIEEAHTYLKVPDSIKDLVVSYVSLLKEAKDHGPRSVTALPKPPA